MTPRAVCLAAALAACGAASAADAAPPERTRVYAFHVLLDGKPIGEHRFTVAVDGAGRRVTSDAAFDVRFLGIEVYRYRHHAEERWSGDCLAALASTTDDDGHPDHVRLQRDGDDDRIETAAGTTTVHGCLMSYAYWNPALLAQTRLLDPQTGRIDAVHVERVGEGTIPVDGQPVAATRWRIVGAAAPIELWISAAGEWVGLDSTVRGGHHLSYRR